MGRTSTVDIEELAEVAAVERRGSRLRRWIADQDRDLDARIEARERSVARLEKLLDRFVRTEARRKRRATERRTNAALRAYDPVREMLIVPILQWALGHARQEARRRSRFDARFADAESAIRSWYASQASRRKGDAARLRDRLMLGGSISRSSVPAEPQGEEQGVAMVAKALLAIEEPARTWVGWWHAELVPPRSGDGDGEAARSASALARAARRAREQQSALDAGRMTEEPASDPHPWVCFLGMPPKAEELVAQAAGLYNVVGGVSREGPARVVKVAVEAAMRELTRALGPLVMEDGRPVLDPAIARRRAMRVVAVDACAGPAFDRGVRLECRSFPVEGPEGIDHPTAASPTCEVCGRPVGYSRVR